MTEVNSEKIYCGYHKIGFDEKSIDIDKYINWEKYIDTWTPLKEDEDYPLMPKECPLPIGNDKRNLNKGKYFVHKYYILKIWLRNKRCDFLGHRKGEFDFGDSYNCERCFRIIKKQK